jgi:hypothetical protein
MTQAYLYESDADDPYTLPSLEVFYLDEEDLSEGEWENELSPGWYWWPCFPGCLPDGDPCGPFDSEDEALADAREGLDE